MICKFRRKSLTEKRLELVSNSLSLGITPHETRVCRFGLITVSCEYTRMRRLHCVLFLEHNNVSVSFFAYCLYAIKRTDVNSTPNRKRVGVVVIEMERLLFVLFSRRHLPCTTRLAFVIEYYINEKNFYYTTTSE